MEIEIPSINLNNNEQIELPPVSDPKSLGMPIDLSKLNTLNVFDKYVFFMLCIMSLLLAGFAITMIIISYQAGNEYTTWLSILMAVWGVWMPTPILRRQSESTMNK